MKPSAGGFWIFLFLILVYYGFTLYKGLLHVMDGIYNLLGVYLPYWFYRYNVFNDKVSFLASKVFSIPFIVISLPVQLFLYQFSFSSPILVIPTLYVVSHLIYDNGRVYKAFKFSSIIVVFLALATPILRYLLGESTYIGYLAMLSRTAALFVFTATYAYSIKLFNDKIQYRLKIGVSEVYG